MHAMSLLEKWLQRNATPSPAIHFTDNSCEEQKLDVYLMPAAFKVLFIPFTTSTTAMSSAN